MVSSSKLSEPLGRLIARDKLTWVDPEGAGAEVRDWDRGTVLLDPFTEPFDGRIVTSHLISPSPPALTRSTTTSYAPVTGLLPIRPVHSSSSDSALASLESSSVGRRVDFGGRVGERTAERWSWGMEEDDFGDRDES